MTRAIDGLVNVDMGDREPPDWMVRVKEDYFKGDDSFFKSPELVGAPRRHGRQRRRAGDPDDGGQRGATSRALAFRRSAARSVRARRRWLQPAEADAARCVRSSRSCATTRSRTPSSGRASGATACTRPPTPVYYPLYTKCCELDLALCLNTGIPGPPLPAEPQHPIHLDRVCYRFPELKLCMIHGADPWWDTAIRLMLKYRNLRLMTSAWSPKRLPASLLHYMSTRGKDRILFASDYPVLSFERCLARRRTSTSPTTCGTPGCTTTRTRSSSTGTDELSKRTALSR